MHTRFPKEYKVLSVSPINCTFSSKLLTRPYISSLVSSDMLSQPRSPHILRYKSSCCETTNHLSHDQAVSSTIFDTVRLDVIFAPRVTIHLPQQTSFWATPGQRRLQIWNTVNMRPVFFYVFVGYLACTNKIRPKCHLLLASCCHTEIVCLIVAPSISTLFFPVVRIDQCYWSDPVYSTVNHIFFFLSCLFTFERIQIPDNSLCVLFSPSLHRAYVCYSISLSNILLIWQELWNYTLMWKRYLHYLWRDNHLDNRG